MQVDVIEASGGSKRSSTKDHEWKSKAACPSDWVTTLLHGKSDGSSVLLEFRSGRKGSPMVAESLPFQTLENTPAYDSVVPLACECWDAAQIHRAELAETRYDYRIRVVTMLEEGGFVSVHESSWVELKIGELDVIAVQAEGGEANGTNQLLSQMVIKLFSANIQLTRAAGGLVRQVTEGASERLASEFQSVDKIKQMAMDLIEQERQRAREDGDAQEVAEFGKTARKWMEMGQEEKLAKAGVKSPKVPRTRKSAASSLFNSLTVAQLSQIKKDMGEERSALLLGLMENAASVSEDQLAELLAEHIGNGVEEQFELKAIMDRVFSQKFVPSTWAIWQARTANVLINGAEEAEANENAPTG